MTKIATLLLLASAAFGQGPRVFDKAAFEAYLRHMEMWIPQVAVQIDDPKPSPYLKGFNEVQVHLSYNGQGKDERYLVSLDGSSMIKGEAYDMTRSPFQGNVDKIKLDGQPSFGGGANAPVTMAIFADFQCPYCKAEAEVVRKNVEKTFQDQVRVVFKDFPLESIHPWARAGSNAGRCVFTQNPTAFWTFHDWIYSVQSEISTDNLTEKVLGWATTNNLDTAKLKACLDSKALDAQVAANLAEGKSLNIAATPTTFLNGRKLEGSLEWPVLEQLIKLELQHLAKSGAK